jgi:hypothetical protein
MAEARAEALTDFQSAGRYPPVIALMGFLWILLWRLFGTEGGNDFQETLNAGS